MRGENAYSRAARNRVGSDLLNAVTFTIAVNDIFPRWQTFELDGQSYIKDRGSAFERVLNKNLVGFLDKRMEEQGY